ncbi:MAG TPA: acyltransferase family protein [Rhizomicrobium sp.]
MRLTQPATHPAPKYRPEIDGLRALAILPVVFFHYRLPYFRGGFAGVDVFFVISGYLITSLITGEMDKGRFTLLEFYVRRIRRIFPALFFMLIVATAAAYILLFPVDLLRYAKSLLATAGFASNFAFWQEAGYFDVASDQKPLLHLWSIAVEEQFYLLFPVFLLILGKNARVRRAGIAAILLLSFGLSVWGLGHDRDAAFYLLPARAWELMLGAILAAGAVPALRNAAIRECEAGAGIVLIAVAVFGLSPQMPFPGPLALIPCLGAALVLHGTQSGNSVVGKALSVRPLVFIGLISYSLYLWHWPIYVFSRYVLFRELTGWESVVLIAVSFAAAVMSWRFVEMPFRRTVARIRLLPAAAAAMAAAFGVGAFASAADGLPQRLPLRLQRILAEQDDHEPRIERCFPLTARDVEAGRPCTLGAAADAPSFLLWGDSHADAIVPPVEQIASRAGREGLFAGGASCVPLLGVTTPAPTCRPFNDAVEKLALSAGIHEVILEARWAKYADGEPYGAEPRGHIVLRDDQSAGTPPADNHAVFARGLERTIRALTQAGKKVILVASIPEVGWPVPAVLARRALARDRGTVSVSFAAYMQRQSFVLAVFSRMHRLYGVTVIYPHEALCANGSCAVSLNGIPLYRDEHHLSVYGALRLEPLLKGIL